MSWEPPRKRVKQFRTGGSFYRSGVTYLTQFAEAFRSKETLEVQGTLLNAAITYRLHNQQLMEVFLKMYDLPSRSEMDEVHRSIYELRQEIKTLKKIWVESQRQEAGRVYLEAK